MASAEDTCHIEKLVDETSFQIWKFQVTVTFKANDLYNIVSGEKLFASLTADKEKAEWIKKTQRHRK